MYSLKIDFHEPLQKKIENMGIWSTNDFNKLATVLQKKCRKSYNNWSDQNPSHFQKKTLFNILKKKNSDQFGILHKL